MTDGRATKPRSPAEVFAEIASLHERVHALAEQPQSPLYRIFLDGAEQVLDWLLESCPGCAVEPRETWDPLARGFNWTLALAVDPDSVKEAGCPLYVLATMKPERGDA